MPNRQSPAFSLKSRQVITGGSLIGAGVVICLSGIAVSGSALVAAARGVAQRARAAAFGRDAAHLGAGPAGQDPG